MLPLFVELRRVTGCSPRRLRRCFSRILNALRDLDQLGGGRIRHARDLPSYGTLHDAFAKADLAAEVEPPAGFRDRVGWFALHVNRAIVSSGRPCELAIFWEPFSRVVFARLEQTFDSAEGNALRDFVGSSLSSIPGELRRHLRVLQLTSPVAAAEGSEFWYSVGHARDARATPGTTPRDERRTSALAFKSEIVSAPRSGRYGPVYFRPFAGDLTRAEAGECLRHWQNAYNLEHGKSRRPTIHIGPHAFDRLPPQTRLGLSLSRPGAPVKPEVLRALLRR